MNRKIQKIGEREEIQKKSGELFTYKINEVIKEKEHTKYLNILLITSTVLVTLSIIAFITYYFPRTFLSPTINGDESKYYSDLIEANNHGLAEAINSGASITFLSVNYFLNTTILNPLLAIRLTSFFSGLLIILTFIVYGKKLLERKIVFFQTLLTLLYCLTLQLTIFIGYNDLMMHFFGFIFWILFLNTKSKNIIGFIAMGVLLALIVATRKMGIIYILVFIALYLLLFFKVSANKNNVIKDLLIITASLLIGVLLINFSSLRSGNGLSFDDKKLEGRVNWSQWEYHNALLIDQGLQQRFDHVDIDKTEKYLLKNGEYSLPATFFEMIIFDISFTWKEFFIDLAVATKYFFRQTGLWPFLFILFFTSRIKKLLKKTFTETDLLYLFSLSYFLLICFIVITNVQMRWFTFFIPIMLLLIAKDLEKINPVHQKLFFTINNFILTSMFIPFWIEII